MAHLTFDHPLLGAKTIRIEDDYHVNGPGVLMGYSPELGRVVLGPSVEYVVFEKESLDDIEG